MSAATEDVQSQNNTPSFISASVVGVALFSAELLLFVLLHEKLKRVYKPRTYLSRDGFRPKSLPSNPITGLKHLIFGIPMIEVLRLNGLDSYSCLRFFWLLVKIFVPLWALTWGVLLPVVLTGDDRGQTGLSMFEIGNVGLTQQNRLAAFCAVALAADIWILYLISNEYRQFAKLRHAHLTSRVHGHQSLSRTVLITGVPKEYMDESKIYSFAQFVPGGIERVWLASRLPHELKDAYKKRNKAIFKLEKTFSSWQRLCVKAKAGRGVEGKDHNGDIADAERGREDITLLVDEKKRPHHRPGTVPIPFISKSVDSLEYLPKEIREYEDTLSRLRQEESTTAKPASSVFIRFQTQLDAQTFCQSNTHHIPLVMSEKLSEISRDDVLWDSLRILPGEAQIRKVLSWAITLGLIIAFLPIVAFVGSVSNVASLCSEYSWLEWICDLPTSIQGIVQGVLPPLLLAIVFALVPIVFRLSARYVEGLPLRSLVALSVFDRYFLFLIIHGFLIVTAASALAKTLADIAENPGQVPQLLAQNLPGASIFFLTYLLTTGLSASGSALAQLGALAGLTIKRILGIRSPRAAFVAEYKLPSIKWETFMPTMALVAVLGIVYLVIQPIIVGLAAVASILLWLVFKYVLIFVVDQPDALDSGGFFYPKLLRALFVGVVIQQLCLTGLFLLARDEEDNVSAFVEAIFMIIAAVLTLIYAYNLQTKYSRILQFAPWSLLASDGVAEEKTNKQAKQTARMQNALEDQDANVEGPSDTTEGQHRGFVELPDQEFLHPALWETAPVAWLAKDEYGMSDQAVRDLQATRLDASNEGAHMDRSGKIGVGRAPPDWDWEGGIDH